MLKEKEAKNKWCPFAMNSFGNRINGLPDYHAIKDSKCIGSLCMAWKNLNEFTPDSDKENYGYCNLMNTTKS